MTNAEYNYENSPIQFSSQELHHTDTDSLPLVLRVDDLMLVLKIGRNAAYALVRSGQIKSLRIGNSYRIPRNELLRFLGESF